MGEDLSVEEALMELGLRRSAPPEEVTRRFRRLAREAHPDHGGDAASFQRLQAAYEVLQRSPVTREAPAPPPRRGAPGWHPPRPVAADPGGIDWSVEVPTSTPRRLSSDLLAVAALSLPSEGVLVARSRGPRTPLNLLTPVLSGDLTNDLRVRRTDRGLRVRLHVRRGRLKSRLMDAELPRSWTRTRENRTVRAERTVGADADRGRLAAARVVAVVEELMAAVDWPLRAWWLEPPPGAAA